MKEIIDLSTAGHAYSSQIKKFKFVKLINEHAGQYHIIAKWPKDVEDQTYLRVGYGDSDGKRVINFIDFDGGPFLRVGSKVDNYIITEFTHNGQLKDIGVILDDRLFD